ncbi:hypothetical protein ACFYOA_33205 [Streptomyces iakyrus]|uniref:hypothetical protein n=1 Tax=Streptomyces iakyrus TaxID=68219 RepID=UPI0036B8DB2C
MALAVLMHHETAATAISPATSSIGHVMTPGMVMDGGDAAPGTVSPGHLRHSTSGRAAHPTEAAGPAMSNADSPPCSGMAMQHCSSASLQVVKLAPPVQAPERWSIAVPAAVGAEPKAGGTVERAPPDLSALSQLRM